MIDSDDDIFGDSLEFADPAPKKVNSKAGKSKSKSKKAEWDDDEDEPVKEVMTAQERIAAMKARLAGIRASDMPEDTSKKGSKNKGGAGGKKSGANRSPLVRFSEAPGMGDDDDELYFEEDEYDLPPPKKSSSKNKSSKNSRPPPPSKSRNALDEFEDLIGGDDDDDVPEVDTRIRSTMALEKHWNEVEEKRKREEALRRRKLKETKAERQNEEQRLLSEIQEKKRREEDLRRRLAEEDLRRMGEDWKRKEEEKRKKYDAKMKARELQLSRLRDARKKREDLKKKITDEEERRHKEYLAEMKRLTTEENELIKKISEEEEAKMQAQIDEEKRREHDQREREKAEEDRKRKEAEEEMRLLEEEEKELLKREQDIERELAEKRRLREAKLRDIQSAMQSSQSRKEEQEKTQSQDSRDDILSFCMQVNASARRIKGTVYPNAFNGTTATQVLVQFTGNQREAIKMGQRLLDQGVFWPIEGSEKFENSDKMFNLEESNDIVVEAKQSMEYGEDAHIDQYVGGGGGGGGGAADAEYQEAEEEVYVEQFDPSQPLAELRVLDDAGQQLPNYEFVLFYGETMIGRRSDNAISLPVLSVSKRHAKIECHEDGSFTMTDLGSSNKTRLFATSSATAPVVLRPNEPYKVYSGAEMLFGEIRCVLTSNLEQQEEYEYEFYEQEEEDDEKANLARFSVAPPMDAAPLPPGASGALAPRSVVNRRKK